MIKTAFSREIDRKYNLHQIIKNILYFIPAIKEKIAAKTGKNLNIPNFKKTLIMPIAVANVTKIVPIVITP